MEEQIEAYRKWWEENGEFVSHQTSQFAHRCFEQRGQPGSRPWIHCDYENGVVVVVIRLPESTITMEEVESIQDGSTTTTEEFIRNDSLTNGLPPAPPPSPADQPPQVEQQNPIVE